MVWRSHLSLVLGGTAFLLSGAAVASDIHRRTFHEKVLEFDREHPDLKSFLTESPSLSYPFASLKTLDARSRQAAEELISMPIDSSCLARLREQKRVLPQVTLVSEAHTCPNCHLSRVERLLDAQDRLSVFTAEGELETEPLADFESHHFPSLLESHPSSVRGYGLEIFAKPLYDQLKTLGPLRAAAAAGMSLAPPAPTKDGLLPLNYDKTLFNDLQVASLLIDHSPLSEIQGKVIEDLARSDASFRVKFAEPLRRLRALAKEVYGRPEAGDKILKAYGDFIASFSPEELHREFSKLLSGVLAELAHSPETSKLFPPTLLQAMKEGLQASGNEDFVTEFIWLAFRSRDFAKRLIKIYCEEGLKSALPIVAQLGSLHLPAVNFYLEREFKKAGLPVAIKHSKDIDYFQSLTVTERRKHVDASLERIEQRLRSKAR
jgi:hypothetical protein